MASDVRKAFFEAVTEADYKQAKKLISDKKLQDNFNVNSACKVLYTCAVNCKNTHTISDTSIQDLKELLIWTTSYFVNDEDEKQVATYLTTTANIMPLFIKQVRYIMCLCKVKVNYVELDGQYGQFCLHKNILRYRIKLR